MDYYHNPRNKNTLKDYNFSSEILNPSCGDSVILQAIIENDTVKLMVFNANGCIISQAAASILTEFCTNKTTQELSKISQADILKLIELDLGPKRLRCATLSLETLKKALENYKTNHA